MTDLPEPRPLTAGHRAARAGDIDALRVSLADPHASLARSPCGWTPLHEAAYSGEAEATEALLDAGADISSAALDGLRPLMLAAGGGHRAVVAQLLEAGAPVDAVTPGGCTALEAAIQCGHLDVAGALVRAGALVDADAAVLYLRALLDRLGISCHLQESQGGLGKQDLTWVWAVDRVMLLPPYALTPIRAQLADELDLSAPLSLRRIRLLAPVEFQLRPEAFGPGARTEPMPSRTWRYRRGWTPRAQAALHGEVPVDEADEMGFLPTLEAIRYGASGVLAQLLEAGGAPDLRPHYGCMKAATLLINAAEQGQTRAAKVLLDGGADVDATTNSGWTALMAAAAHNHTETALLLVQAGADLWERNAQGRSAMALARDRGHAQMARMLMVAANRPRAVDRYYRQLA